MRPLSVIIFLVIAWVGFTGLRDNFVHSELMEFSVDRVEAQGVGDARYIVVRHATPQGTYMVERGAEDGSVRRVIFPVTSARKAAAALGGEKVALRLYIERNTENEVCNAANTFCITMEPTSFKGTIKKGGDAVDEGTRDLFAEAGFSIPENIIILSENRKPLFGWFDVAILAFGLIGLGFCLRGPGAKEQKSIDRVEEEVNWGILEVMAHVAAVDGKVGSAELEMIAELYQQLTDEAMSMEEVQRVVETAVASDHTPITYLEHVREWIPEDEKEMILRAGALVMMADGVERDSELDLLMSIATTLDIPSERATVLLNELMQDE
jgi:tellurite resistance protein